MLAEAGFGAIDHDLVSVDAHGLEAASDWANLKSIENYIGHERTENFSSPYGAELGKRRVYTSPNDLKLNHWALSGVWTFQKNFIVLSKPNGRIGYRFHSRDLHLVMGPEVKGAPIQFQVLIDGQIPGASHGIDTNEEGRGIVTEPRLYQLIRQPKSIVERLFEITFLDSGVEAFAFTFG